MDIFQDHQFQEIESDSKYECIEPLESLMPNSQSWVEVVKKLPKTSIFQSVDKADLYVRKKYRVPKPSETTKEYIHLRREYQILRKLRHPHIVRYVDFEQKLKNGTLKTALYMEYCQGGDLTQYTMAGKEVSKDEFWQIFVQLASALLYCHTGWREDESGNLYKDDDWSQAVLHRDVKPSNGMFRRFVFLNHLTRTSGYLFNRQWSH